jgi:carboxymethylenebutenolidase
MIFLLGLAALAACAGDTKSCCSATEEFAALGNDASFVAMHDLRQGPAPVSAGKTVTGKTADGAEWQGWLVLPKGGSKGSAVVMIHEFWGLNVWIKAQADELAKEGYAVLAVDLYEGKVATTRDDAVKYMQAVQEPKSEATLLAAVEYLRTNPQIKAERIGTIGWCFGGGWSLRTALLAGDKVQACVMYYGMPERDTEKLKALKAPVLGIFGEKDARINPDVVHEFQKSLDSLGKPNSMHIYPADHAFANPSASSYNSEAAKSAWKLTLEFLKKHLSKQN